jgi:hypothetical protein
VDLEVSIYGLEGIATRWESGLPVRNHQIVDFEHRDREGQLGVV